MKYSSWLKMTSLLALSTCLSAEAVIQVQPVVVYFASKPGASNIQDITITNTDTNVAYVQIKPATLENNGNSMSMVPFNPAQGLANFGLLISPLKLAVPPNSARKVRIAALKNNPSQDAIYYLDISTVAAPFQQTATAAGSSVQMSNSIAYRVQTVIFPANPKPVLSLSREGNHVIVKNTGNTYAALSNAQLCNSSGADCKPLNTISYHILYANTSWEFNLPSSGVVSFNTSSVDGSQKSQIKSN